MAATIFSEIMPPGMHNSPLINGPHNPTTNPSKIFIQKSRVEGSNRAPFKSIKLEHIPPDGQTGGSAQSTSIIAQNEYKGMSIMMVRLEDYYLIRSKQLLQFQEKMVETACRCGQFNSQLITQANPQTLTIPSFPNVRNTWNSSSSQNSNQIFNSSQNQMFPQTNSNNIFGPTQAPAGNIFSNKPPTPAHNLFQNPNNNQNNPINPFQQQNQSPFNSSSNNVFKQPGNNIFAQPAQQQPNIFAQQPSQNMFPQANIFGQQPPTQNMFGQQPVGGMNLFNQPPLFQNMQQPMFNSYPYQQYSPYPQYPQYSPYQQMPMMPNLLQTGMYPPNTQQIQEQVVQLQNCAEIMSNKLQIYLQNQEEEQKRLEQQETLIKEYEQQRYQNRQQRERVLNQPISSHRAAKSKSPTPNQASRVNSHSQLNKSQMRESICSIQSFNSPQTKTKTVEVTVCFMESEKSIFFCFTDRPSSLQIGDVKFMIEMNLTQKQVFREKRDTYFSNCIIRSDNQIQNLAKKLEFFTSSVIKLDFEYFCTIEPILSKEGYKMNYEKGNSLKNLNNFQNFTIETQYGSVKWLTPCDLSYLDLDRIIEMQQECINVYDQSMIHEYLKPEVGKKLNKECEITFKLPTDCKIQDPVKFEKRLREQAQDQEIDFQKFNLEERSYTFRVYHFSHYQFNSDFYTSDDSTFQVQVNQIGVQTNFQESMAVEQQNDESDPDDLEDEEFLEIKKQFNKQRPIPINRNEAIEQFNLEHELDVPINIEDTKIDNPELLPIFFCENPDFSHQPLKVRISAKLITALWLGKDNSLAFKLKLFNTLFGNAQVKISHFVKQIKIGMITLEDLNQVQLEKAFERGFALSLLFESQKKQQSMDFRQILLKQNKLKPIENVLITLNSKQLIQTPENDFIDQFNNWKLNNGQPCNQWWLSLYDKFKAHPINSSEEAAFIYYLLKKSKQSQTEYASLFSYLSKGNDVFTFLLFHIMIHQNKVTSDSLKIIGRTLISKLMELKTDFSIIEHFLTQLKGSLYTIEEIEKIETLVCKSKIYRLNAKGKQAINFALQEKDFQRAALLIFQQRKTEEYQDELVECILPYLILEYEQSSGDKTKILVQQIINAATSPSSMIALAQLFLGKIPYSSDLFDNAEQENVYQYHMKKKLQHLYDDEF